MRFGSWETLRQLGEGSFGEVYLAQRPVAKGSTVMQSGALKVLHANAGQLERRTMANEIERLSDLNHPNLSRFIESGVKDTGEQWFVMDFVEGIGLHTRLQQQGTLPESEWITFTRSLLGALSYLRSRNMSHLDIKPDNIIRANSGSYTLVDFGLSSKIFGTGQGVANAYCASPEQLNLVDNEESPASDVFSLAICIYLASTGEHPWLNSQHRDYKQSLMTRSSNLSKLDEKYRLWIEPALAINPANRPYAQTLLEEFDSLVFGDELPSQNVENPQTWAQLKDRLIRDVRDSLDFEVTISSSTKGRWRFVSESSLEAEHRLYLASDSTPTRAISPSERSNLISLGWRAMSGNSQLLYLDLENDALDPEQPVGEIISALRSGLLLGIENLTITHST